MNPMYAISYGSFVCYQKNKEGGPLVSAYRRLGLPETTNHHGRSSAVHSYPAMYQSDKPSSLIVFSRPFSLSGLRNFVPLSLFSLLRCTRSHLSHSIPSPQTIGSSSLSSSKNRVSPSLYISRRSAPLPSLCASEKMDVPEKLVRLRFHLIFAALGILLLAALLYLAPSFVSLLSYFWPLLLSTALFLVAVFLFHQISPPESDSSSHHKAGEQLLDYVAGQPEVSAGIKDSKEEEEENKEAMKSE